MNNEKRGPNSGNGQQILNKLGMDKSNPNSANQSMANILSNFDPRIP